MENKNRKNIRFEDDLKGIKINMWEKRTCPICGRNFYARKKYEKITCSDECYSKYISNNKEEINKKRSETLKKTNLKKDIETKRKELLKARKTCLERYGVDMYQKTEQYRNMMSKKFREKDWSERSKKVQNRLIEKYDEICKNDDLELVEFRGRFDCTVRCKKCGNVFDTHVLGYLTDKTNHNLCRCCFPVMTHVTDTTPLIFVENILIENGVEYVKNDRTMIKPYEIDLFISSLNIGFEINGNYWHSEFSFGRDKNYHLNKTKLAFEKDIRLVQIFEDEIVNKPEIVKSRILNIINKTPCKIYARNCKVIKIEHPVKKDFLIQNHIDGDSISKYNYGLFYDNDLVSVATFGSRKISGKQEFELIRFANKLNINVIGGFSKLLTHFINDIKPDRLITYADIRWSGMNYLDSVYSKNGYKTVNKKSNKNYT